jgi:hypothetical protein
VEGRASRADPARRERLSRRRRRGRPRAPRLCARGTPRPARRPGRDRRLGLALLHPHRRTRRGGRYATAVALGFSSFENVLYLPHLAWPARLARAAATPLAHSVFAALWGLGWARGRFESRTALGRFLWPASTLVAAAIVHAAYDLAILAYGALALSGVLVFAVWAWLVLRAKALVADAGPAANPARETVTVRPPVARRGPPS